MKDRLTDMFSENYIIDFFLLHISSLVSSSLFPPTAFELSGQCVLYAYIGCLYSIAMYTSAACMRTFEH